MKQKKSRPTILDKIKHLLHTKPSQRQLLIAGGTLVITIGLAGLFMNVLNSKDDAVLESIKTQEIVVEPVKIQTEAAKLSGAQIDPILNERPVTGIILENSVDARPQSGLVDAEVVFEAIAEGGITRFLALYQVNQPDNIGPVRSARPYFVQWTSGFDANFVHSGGSGEALNLIRTLGLNDLDHGTYDSYFTRVSNRYAPHNVYTSMSRLDSLREARGFTEPSDFNSLHE